MPVGLQNFQYFISVADNKSFVETSKETWVSQPAVSYHINKLEKFFGIRLFNRCSGSNSIQLTSEGKILYDLVKPFVNEINNLHDYWRGQNKEETKITIGATFIHANYILPILIPILREKYEEKKIKISVYTDNNSSNIMSDLVQLKTDIGMIILNKPKPIPYPELEIVSIRREKILIVVRTGHPLFGRKISLKELGNFPLIVPPFSTDPGFSIGSQLLKKKIQANSFIEVDSIELAKKVVLEGANGGALIPEIAVLKEIEAKKLSVLDDSNNIYIDYAIVVNPKNNNLPEKRTFLNLLASMYNIRGVDLLKKGYVS